MQDLDRLLNPEKRFLEYQDYLIDLISSSYHKSFKDLISRRIKNTLYFFESTPDITYESLYNLNKNLDILKEYKALMDDYMGKGKLFRGIIDDYVSIYLQELLNISDDVLKKNKEEILDLRFDVFSKKYKKYLDYDNMMKTQLQELQHDYLYTCKRIGIEPLLDEDKIEDCLKFMNKEEKVLEQNVIRTTSFGKIILNKLDCIKGITSSERLLIARNIFYFDEDFDENAIAITMLCKVSKDYSWTILSFPILKQYLMTSLDASLLHELIHVSEMSNEMCSIVVNEDYRIFNEFRTQDKARYLFERLRKDNVHIFDQDNNDDSTYESTYDSYLPLVDSLLDNYRELFDYSAINNRLSIINNNLGKDNFINYCNFLTSLYENSFNMYGQSFDRNTISKNNDLVNKIKTYSKNK